jgi:hypothetical protein
MAKKTTARKQNPTAAEIQAKASKVHQALWRANSLFDTVGILWDADCVDDFDYSEYLQTLRSELTNIIRETVSGAAVISADVVRYLHEQNCPAAKKPSLVTPVPVTPIALDAEEPRA